ncbi:nucleotidyltransferase family protein [Pseudoclavibacter sp. VKM Ac-2888]|uniref:nucleotidyltransferase family protein n=1 Tax=Pseudoclavibacter sp. VKM Ac-2888 TaxID=2783830 RepID=UPI00188BDEA5|nr:nucleotidyltransferase family protein [Pseudoclavibacter sp. VKM Ac-2888]MBF4550798.1 nucleotidyltransferase family protein [Pseudoclavibacter sp. VKM Ac-2888]
MNVCGVVLAAGAGSRFGGPKALASLPDGTPWVARAVETLLRAGCSDVLVALGAGRSEAAALVPASATVVPVPEWSGGLAASVRAALHAAAMTDADAVLLVPVDTPDLSVASCRRVLSAGAVLARATYRGEPGHPVLIGRTHWAALASTLDGDRGAGRYLAEQGAVVVECGDLWHGRDIDEPVVPPVAARSPRHPLR